MKAARSRRASAPPTRTATSGHSQAQSHPTEAEHLPAIAWRDAEVRLDYLIRRAGEAAADPTIRYLLRFVTKEPPKPPVLLPARFAGFLYGPDGKLMEENA